MTLLPDVECSEVEPQKIRLHSLHEGENAGSLLGTRKPALFLPHCRRRGKPDLSQCLLARTGRKSARNTSALGPRGQTKTGQSSISETFLSKSTSRPER